jgi:hypothetical protein
LFSLFFRRPLPKGSWLIRLACSAVLVGAHYREADCDDKGIFEESHGNFKLSS